MKKNSLLTLCISAITLLIVNCGKPYTTVAPQGFATYTKGIGFKSVSSDHIVYRVRTCTNKPYTDFKFWREALPEQMKNAGYRLVSDSVITVKNQQALLLEMAAPVNDADYSYMVMMMVKKKKILIAEAAGVYDVFQHQKSEIIAALSKTSLK